MKQINLLLTTLIALSTLTMCTSKSNQGSENPFFCESKTPHGTFPFDQLKNEHFLPAMEEAIKQHNAEIDAIIKNQDAPTFENTIEAIDRAGGMLNKVASVFFALNSAETNDEMQKIAQEISPMLTEHGNNITLNEELFARVKTVYEQKEKLDLNPEQARLLQSSYESFANNGADLPSDKKAKYKELSKELSIASLNYGQNTLAQVNSFNIVIEDKERLSGLSDDFINDAAKKAADAGKEGFLLDLKGTCFTPIMTYADDRKLREEIWKAYNTQCFENTEYSNIENMKKIINTRLAIAQLFGFENYAQYSLKDKMAKNPENVYELLDHLLDAYTAKAKDELASIQQYATELGADFTIQPWDYSYYSNKLKTAEYSLNDEILKPYFKLENVTNGVFGLANTLYKINFTENKDIPVYHEDVKAYDVTDENGNFLAVLYTDFHPRAGKRSGAWMTEYKGQWKEADGTDSRPHITIVMNFTKPTDVKPALLTFNEVETFLHEFGHALHGMLSNCTYYTLSGTNVYRDFVELPSQVMENWAIEKEWLDGFAVHYETGEAIPAEYIENLIKSSNFDAGYACLRQLSFGYQDMAFHTITEPFNGNVLDIEQESTAKANLLPSIENTGRSTTFSHIFTGGYAAGYYSYKWAEVLDADAYAAFKENGIFNTNTANKFRENILSKGNTADPMELYINFRGKEPSVDALLERNGVK